MRMTKLMQTALYWARKRNREMFHGGSTVPPVYPTIFAVMIVGNSGETYGYEQAAFGTLTPNTNGQIVVNKFTVGQNLAVPDLCSLHVAGDIPIPGVSGISVRIVGSEVSFGLTWNALNSAYEAEVTGLKAIFVTALGHSESVEFRFFK